MSETAKKLFDSLKETVQDRIKDIGPEATAELSRLGKHGATELAAALFTGNTFVMYGPGQQTVQSEHEQEQSNEPVREQQSRGRD